jgi:ketosteroid isomerase-like protein
MKRLLLMMTLAASAILSLAQGENPQIRREIEQVYFKLDRLAEKGDVNGIMAMVSPSVVVTDVNGRVTGWNDMRAMTRQMARTMRDIKMSTRIESIQSQGPEVVAWTTTTASYRQLRNGSWRPMTMTQRCAHTLKRIDGRWLFVAAQNLPKM